MTLLINQDRIYPCQGRTTALPQVRNTTFDFREFRCPWKSYTYYLTVIHVSIFAYLGLLAAFKSTKPRKTITYSLHFNHLNRFYSPSEAVGSATIFIATYYIVWICVLACVRVQIIIVSPLSQNNQLVKSIDYSCQKDTTKVDQLKMQSRR